MRASFLAAGATSQAAARLRSDISTSVMRRFIMSRRRGGIFSPRRIQHASMSRISRHFRRGTRHRQTRHQNRRSAR